MCIKHLFTKQQKSIFIIIKKLDLIISLLWFLGDGIIIYVLHIVKASWNGRLTSPAVEPKSCVSFDAIRNLQMLLEYY